jgi:RimJ/RimL family protein N-acetyltransferase
VGLIPVGSAVQRTDEAVMTGSKPVVREMQLDEVDLRIDYFHQASDDYLRRLGVDRARLLTPEAWRSFYQEDYARPLQERENYSLVWELDGRTVGFSSADHIVFGKEAFLHLHMVEPQLRQEGFGAVFVSMSAEMYFRDLELEQLFSEPNAFNTAPNRTLQRAGFRYLFTHEAQPGPMNFLQVTNRWVMDRPPNASG